MNEIIEKLQALKDDIYRSNRNYDLLTSSYSKLSSYVANFFSSERYRNELNNIKGEPENDIELNKSFSKINALIDTLIDEAKTNDSIRILPKEKYNELYKIRDENDRLKNQLDSARANLSDEKTKHKIYTDNIKLDQVSYQTKEINYKNEIQSLKEELSSLKELKQKTEIAKNSEKFQKQANANKINAQRWMIAVVAAIGVFVIVLMLFVLSGDELFSIASGIQAKANTMNAELVSKITYIEIAKRLASKVLIYSMVIYLISFLVKNYNAQMHNYVVNSHKANALSSTVDLIGTAKSDDGNDKILAQATQAIFTTQRSGYQGVESEPNSPNVITNVIDAVMPKKG